MPVAPAISSSLAILVSAEMLISFIADSEIVWAGAACGAAPAGAGLAAPRRRGASPWLRPCRLGRPRPCRRGGGGGGYAAVWLGSLAIIFHSSSSPSPVCAETSGTGTSNNDSKFTSVARPLGARQLVHLGPDDAGGHGCDCSHAHASEVRLEPGMPRVDEQQHGPSRPGRREIRLRQPLELLRGRRRRRARIRSRADRPGRAPAPLPAARGRSWPGASCLAPRSCAPAAAAPAR